jgi:hypothetical protein
MILRKFSILLYSVFKFVEKKKHGVAFGRRYNKLFSLYFFFFRSYHPDMQRNASEAEKARAEERSKLISAAYRKLKESQR